MRYCEHVSCDNHDMFNAANTTENQIHVNLPNGVQTPLSHNARKPLHAGATIGIVGGGQLGRMMAIAARYHGFRVVVLDPTPNCPTAQVADEQVVAAYDDGDAIAQLASKSDVLTYEFENVDADALDTVRGLTDIPQGTDLLRVTQHRVHEKQFIQAQGVATAPWRTVNSEEDARQAVRELGYPCVLKTASGGYDGHGQAVLHNDEELDAKLRHWYDNEAFIPSVLEGFVDFAYEASILVSGNGSEYVTFPVVQNIHHNNILHMTIATHRIDTTVQQQCEALAYKLARGFQLSGTLAIELFVTKRGDVIVNELAPRPHNSGHYTIEACSIDQFDAHIRGIVGWPLQQPLLLSEAVMINVLGQHQELVQAALLDHPEWSVHDYGKAEAKHNRKMGHVTCLVSDAPDYAQSIDALGIW